MQYMWQSMLSLFISKFLKNIWNIHREVMASLEYNLGLQAINKYLIIKKNGLHFLDPPVKLPSQNLLWNPLT